MTYNEWRDELKNNLLSVSDSERMRVLDYYAEAYADRREAGFSEREIIQDFGAPYDAAQRILYENDYFEPVEPPKTTQYGDRRRCGRDPQPDRGVEREPQPQPQPTTCAKTKKRDDFTWVFVLLCIVFAVPLFCLIMAMVGVTIGMCVAPFGFVADGVLRAVSGIGMAYTNVAAGFAQIGIGLIQAGVGLALVPLFIWLVKLMWKLFRKIFSWLKSLFSGKEEA